MKTSPQTALIAAMAAVIVVLAAALVYFGRDEFGAAGEKAEDEIAVATAPASQSARPEVRVPAARQAASGLGVQALPAAKLQAAAEVYGVVVNLQPLFDLRARYLAAVGEARALRAASAASTDEYRRAKGLFEDDRNVSERAVLAAQAQARGDQARLVAADQTAEAVMSALRAEWGATVAGWAQRPGEGPLDALAAQREVLVQFTFPDELREYAGHAAVAVAPVAGRAAARPARFVSPAPRTDPTLSGTTYFYAASTDGLRVGMRVAGRVRLGGEARDGVILPAAAVVWHGGKAWAYLKEGDDLFVRKEVATADPAENGWFDASHFAPGDAVVVSGAQLLLSEELRFQIRNENKD